MIVRSGSTLWAILPILLVLIACTGCRSAQNLQPNLIVILADDLGYGDLAMLGNSDVRTPHLDRMAQQSVRLDTFYAMPVCAPTRAALLTGRDFLRTGVWGVHGGRDYLNLAETTIAQRLHQAGYRTAMLGKWHLGKTSGYLPHERGFDRAWTITDRLYQHTDPVLNHNGRAYQPEGWTAEILTDLAIRELTRHDDQRPVFLYLAHPLIHEPFYAPRQLIDRYLAEGHSESLAALYAMTEHLDQEVGRLLEAVDRLDSERETIVIFLGDNGPIGNPMNLPHLTDAEMARRNPRNWKGNKGHVWENGARVACFVYAPRRFPPRVDRRPAGVIDLAPTLLEWAGAAAPDAQFDGVSLATRISQPDLPVRDRHFFIATHDAMWPARRSLYDRLPSKKDLAFEDQVLAVRYGRFKYVQGYGGFALHDLDHDPGEQSDASSRFPKERQQLENLLHAWYRGVLASDASYAMPVFQITGEPQIMEYAYACAPSDLVGTLRRGSHATHNWRPGDTQSLTLDVTRAGTYQIGIEAHIEEPGHTMELSVRASSLKHSLSSAFSQTLGELNLEMGVQEVRVSLSEETEDKEAVIMRELQRVTFRRVTTD
ncbi:MAG: sulfatase-like hydrolase/transferase [Phycisphaeraceae bacterium]